MYIIYYISKKNSVKNLLLICMRKIKFKCIY